MLALTLVVLMLGLAMKVPCSDLPYTDGREYSGFCYTDIQKLFLTRDVAAFPPGEDGSRALEYPVLTQLFAWAPAQIADTPGVYLWLSAALLGSIALGITWGLVGMVGRRTIFWAAAPSLALFAFHNWDILPVAAVVGALYLWARNRPLAASAVLGIGGALKIYPLILLLPLAVWASGERGSAKRGGVVMAWGLGAFALVNVPFLIASPTAWKAPLTFQLHRGANFDSIWNWLPTAEGSLLPNAVSVILTAAATIYVLKRLRLGSTGFVQACGALVCIFFLFSKVQSPQYSLWVIPFFCLIAVQTSLWVTFEIINVIVFFSVFSYLGDGAEELGVWGSVTIVSIFVRAVMLGALALSFLDSRSELEPSSPGVSLST